MCECGDDVEEGHGEYRLGSRGEGRGGRGGGGEGEGGDAGVGVMFRSTYF